MFALREHDHRDVAVQIPPHQTGGIPLAMPRSSSSVSQRATSAHGQGDLRITVRAYPASASPRASHSSSTSHHLVFPDELAGPSDRAGPSISFGAPADDRMLIAASEGELGSGDDDSAVLPPAGRVALPESDPELTAIPRLRRTRSVSIVLATPFPSTDQIRALLLLLSSVPLGEPC